MGSNRFWHIVSIVKERYVCLPVQQSGLQQLGKISRLVEIVNTRLQGNFGFPHESSEDGVGGCEAITYGKKNVFFGMTVRRNKKK